LLDKGLSKEYYRIDFIILKTSGQGDAMWKSVSFGLAIFIILFSLQGEPSLCFAQSDSVIATVSVGANSSALVYNSTKNRIYSENEGSLIVDDIRMPIPHKFIDYDGDGLLDLVRKEADGKVYVYINKGSNENPVYREGIPHKGEEIEFEQQEFLEIPKTIFPGDSIPGYVYLPYDRFEVYIESVYYYNNTPEIDEFFDYFEQRYALLESWTDWSAEEYYDEKLFIEVRGTTGCYGGGGGSGFVILYFSDPLYMSGCEWAYRENGQWQWGNPGELGDWWFYMAVAIHEATHAINPEAILWRSWLTEGWAVYDMFNILAMYYGNSYPDINQETADYCIYQGSIYYNWEGYVANDYHDTSPDSAEIQNSSGYYITGWMLSMLRDDYSLPWQDLYFIIDNNKETMDKAWDFYYYLGNKYYIDAHVIDLFERAIGTPMYPVFRYDGPDGPGWGVRHWENLDWYADLTPVLEVSDTTQSPGQSIWVNASIYNNGDVGLNDVVVRFYSNDSLINEQTTDVDSNGFVTVSTQYSALEGLYDIKVVVDEDNLKIEQDDSNNEDSVLVTFEAICGDVNNDEIIDIADVVYLINYLFINGPEPLCEPITTCGDVTLDDIVNIADVVYLINYLFTGGLPPDC